MKSKKKVQEYFEKKKELQENLLSFLDNYENSNINFDFLKNQFKAQKLHSDKEELEHFLRLLLNIANNHHRQVDFFSKIERILLELQDDLKNLPVFKLFNIFVKNKRILLFLLERQMIIIDESIFNSMFQESEKRDTQFCHFFLPEIKIYFNEHKKSRTNDESFQQFDEDIILKLNEKKIEQIEREISELNLTNNNFEKYRKIGENDSYIATLIREDSIEEFISYISRTNLPLSSQINQSIFETNQFLIGKNPTLIEYASFFGSIQILNFLRFNNVKLTSSLWIYAIHSNSAEFIHILEEIHLELDEDSFLIGDCQKVGKKLSDDSDDEKEEEKEKTNPYEILLKESIKCHHNEMAKYIEDNYLFQFSQEKIISCSFHFYNYLFFPKSFDQNFGFFYLSKYNYKKIVKFYIQKRNIGISSIQI